MYKLFAALLIFIGESLFVYAEMLAAFEISTGKKTYMNAFLDNLLTISFGGIMVIWGYIEGIRHFQSIWVVAVLSFLGMLLVEPFIAYYLFRSLPELGALLGMVFGLIGCGFTLIEDSKNKR